jgi:hypothetical protein
VRVVRRRLLRAALWSALMTFNGLSTAEAQICAGGMAYNFAPLQVGVVPGWSDEGTSAAASVGMGSDYVFGAVTTGWHSGGDDEPRVWRVAVDVGTDQPLRVDNRLRVCPVLTVVAARRGDRSSAAAGGHVALGWVARNEPGLLVVPTAALGLRHRAEHPAAQRPLEHAIELDAGLGVVLHARVAVIPRVTVAWPRRFARTTTFALAAHVGFR